MGADQLSLRGVASKVEGVPIAIDKVLEVRLPLRALQAAPELVEVVKLEKEGAIGQAQAVMRRLAEAHRQPMTELGELQQVLSRLEAALEVGQDHELAPPQGLGSKMPKSMRSKYASLGGKSLVDSFLLRVKDLRRSLAGGLRSVCMTRSCPAYA
eukprot:6193405-Pleurochrysis_carterae.AAC.3